MRRTPPEAKAPILVLARQAGSAAAFDPLIAALEAEHQVVRGALGMARAAWKEQAQVSGERFEELAAALNAARSPSLLITGTSAEPLDDAKAWAWGKSKSIPTLAFVDSWVNLKARFTDTTGAWLGDLPDHILVIDEASKRHLAAAGMAPERIHVVGTPVLDAVVAKRTPPPDQAEGLTLLFASQPLRGRGFPEAWDEHHALDMLLAALSEVELPAPIHLILRRHPAEDVGVFERRPKRLMGGRVTLSVDTRQDRLDAISGAHLVLGIVSMLLVEAQWLGRPALSLQAGAHAPSDLLELNNIPVISSSEGLCAHLRALASAPFAQQAHLPLALPRWRSLLEACLLGR